MYCQPRRLTALQCRPTRTTVVHNCYNRSLVISPLVCHFGSRGFDAYLLRTSPSLPSNTPGRHPSPVRSTLSPPDLRYSFLVARHTWLPPHSFLFVLPVPPLRRLSFLSTPPSHGSTDEERISYSLVPPSRHLPFHSTPPSHSSTGGDRPSHSLVLPSRRLPFLSTPPSHSSTGGDRPLHSLVPPSAANRGCKHPSLTLQFLRTHTPV